MVLQREPPDDKGAVYVTLFIDPLHAPADAIHPDEKSVEPMQIDAVAMPPTVCEALNAWLVGAAAAPTAAVSAELGGSDSTVRDWDSVTTTSKDGTTWSKRAQRYVKSTNKAEAAVVMARPSVGLSNEDQRYPDTLFVLYLDVGYGLKRADTPLDFDRHASTPTITSAHGGLVVKFQAVPHDTPFEKSAALLEPARMLWVSRQEEELPTTLTVEPHRLDWDDGGHDFEGEDEQ